MPEMRHKNAESVDKWGGFGLRSTVSARHGNPMTKSKQWAAKAAAGAVTVALLAAITATPALADELSSTVDTTVPAPEVTPDPVPSVDTPTRTNTLTNRAAFVSRGRDAILAARALAPHHYYGYYRTSKYAKWYAARHISHKYGWGKKQFKCLTKLWQGESSWRPSAREPHNKYLGIPQLAKKAVVASGYTVAEFRASTELQIQLGAKYIKYRKGYGSPCRALSHFNRKNWY